MRRITFIIALFSVNFILMLSGCISQPPKVEGYSSPGIQEMQRVIPFKIVLPKYLPEELRTARPQANNLLGIDDKGTSRIEIHYEIMEQDKYVWLEERNNLLSETPSKEDTIFNIGEVKILERPWQSVYTLKSNGFLYDWSNNGVQFTVDIIGYDKYECRKVIESMIK